MIFGFGKKGRPSRDADDDDEEDEDDLDLVLFKGALNGNNPDLSENARLVQAGLIPAKKLVSEALARRAEMIRVDPKGKVAAVTYLVDGIAYPAAKMPPPAANAITQMLKLLAGLNINEKSKNQSGGINAEFDDIKYEVRIDTAPVEEGRERLTVRVQNIKEKLETPKDLGFSDALQNKIREIGSSKSGFMLAAGPPMSGVTTLSIAMVRGIDAYLYAIASIADLQGRDLPHIQDFEKKEEDNFEETIRRTKRSDVDVLYVDPIANAEQAKTILQAAGDQCLIAEMPAKDAADAIIRLLTLCGDPKLLTQRLKMVISQKLIRILCRKCRHAYRPNPKLIAKIGLPKETNKLYRAPRQDDEDDDEELCENCGGTGYRGRIGLIEVIEMTEEIQSLILSGTDAATIRTKARELGMQSFQTDGIRLVGEGKTSLEELQRAFRT